MARPRLPSGELGTIGITRLSSGDQEARGDSALQHLPRDLMVSGAEPLHCRAHVRRVMITAQWRRPGHPGGGIRASSGYKKPGASLGRRPVLMASATRGLRPPGMGARNAAAPTPR